MSTTGAVVLILLFLVLAGVFPTWPYSISWGSGPTISVGTLLFIVLILVMFRMI